MASLQQAAQTGIFRIRFRFERRSYNRTLKTKDLKSAGSILGRTGRDPALIASVRLEIPPKMDPASFVLGDGKIQGRPKMQIAHA